MEIIKIIKEVPEEVILPDGEYKGYWTGRTIRVTYLRTNYKLTTRKGKRCINSPVIVTIINGIAKFELVTDKYNN